MKRSKSYGKRDKRYFSKHVHKTRAINVNMVPRGGYRL